jgi:hypothetical protein
MWTFWDLKFRLLVSLSVGHPMNCTQPFPRLLGESHAPTSASHHRLSAHPSPTLLSF